MNYRRERAEAIEELIPGISEMTDPTINVDSYGELVQLVNALNRFFGSFENLRIQIPQGVYTLFPPGNYDTFESEDRHLSGIMKNPFQIRALSGSQRSLPIHVYGSRDFLRRNPQLLDVYTGDRFEGQEGVIDFIGPHSIAKGINLFYSEILKNILRESEHKIEGLPLILKMPNELHTRNTE